MQKQYISGHDIRRFFIISGSDLRKIRDHIPEHVIPSEKHKLGFYKLYDLAYITAHFKVRDGNVPPHMIISL